MVSLLFWLKKSLKFVPRDPTADKSAFIHLSIYFLWLDDEQAQGNFLNSWRPSSLMEIVLNAVKH